MKNLTNIFLIFPNCQIKTIMKNHKATLILSILLFPLLLQGQKKVTYSVFITPEFSFINLQNTTSLNSGLGNGRTEPTEGIGFGYALGGALDYEIRKSFVLKTGFQYEVSKHKFNIKEVVGTPFVTENIATINTISIPISLAKKIHSNNTDVNYLPTLGIMFNINLKKKSDSKGFNTISPAKFSGIFSWEIEQTLKNNLRFSIEPLFKYTPNRFTIFANVVQAKTNFELGMNFRLKF